MSPLKYWMTVICTLFIAIGAASGQEVKNVFVEVGGRVSFQPTSINPYVSSILWKQRDGESVVKAIEWDAEDGVFIPNKNFNNITTLNKETGQITITNLTVERSGLYTIDINHKEEEQRFKLEVLPPVPKPVIKIEIKVNPDAVYLICEFSETIIWKNSTGGTLQGSPQSPKGEFIKVEKQGNPDFFYTCTLENALRNSTSDPVYERDLFKDTQLEKGAAKRNDGGSPWIVPTVIILILILAPIILYKVWEKFHKIVHDNFKDTPCIGAILKRLDGKNSEDIQSVEESTKMTINVDAQPGGESTVNGDPQPGGEPNGEEEKQEDDKQNEILLDGGESETPNSQDVKM
ncbi:SLAM family member 7-like isoform X1 [Carassius auratus]|uniref:SLAM family member 7-like isoform X1 n=1 Tax=Carassius auratus TaxID=7957 RepID=A0A6P6JLS6_CARAU|nr:SLAM family member 7-like isoform X1 [Carassius auratus]